MKKQNLLILTTAIIIIVIFSCSKETIVEKETDCPQQSVFAHVPIIEKYISIDKKDDLFLSLIEVYGEDLPVEVIDYENLDKVIFRDYPYLEGLVIPLEMDRTGQRITLFTVRNQVTGESLTLYRSIKGFDNTMSGSISFTSLYGELILFTEYKDGLNINEIIPILESPTKGWNCTDEEFSEIYFMAKEACESDLLCDVACAFNPCTIAYLAAAVIECFSKEEE